MTKNIFTIIITIALISCHNRNDEEIILTGTLPENKIDYQQTIVGHLSGEYPLADNVRIKSRWSKSERKQAQAYLRVLLKQMNIVPLENHYTAANLNPAIDMILDPFKGVNIYGILPATIDSDEYIVLGAHYDTGKRNAPGAIDNATGIALIYSVVKELSKRNFRSKNIIAVFFDQEEEELIGSKAFIHHMQKQDWTIHSVHCFDMVGWDSDGDKAMEIYSPSASLRSFYKEIAENQGIPLREKIIDPINYDKNSTDFDAFVPWGYDVIGGGECFYTGDYTPYKDSPDDTYDTVNFPYLLSCSDLVEAIIVQMVTE